MEHLLGRDSLPVAITPVPDANTASFPWELRPPIVPTKKSSVSSKRNATAYSCICALLLHDVDCQAIRLNQGLSLQSR